MDPFEPFPKKPTKVKSITSDNASDIALSALIWVLTDDDRAGRLLAMTGLTPDSLREGLRERSLQAAILQHLENYEPDLLAFAEAEGIAPQSIVAAARLLSD